MSKLISEMASGCSTDRVDIQSLADKYGIGDGEDLSERVEFVLIGLHYNVQSNRIDDNTKYDVFCLCDMKRRAKF